MFKYNLTEYIKNCSLEDMNKILNQITTDDIVGINANIFDAILTELEYRKEENKPKSSRR